jgi:hypothetical protein
MQGPTTVMSFKSKFGKYAEYFEIWQICKTIPACSIGILDHEGTHRQFHRPVKG